MSAPQNRSSVEVFSAQAAALIERFVYVSDDKQYGRAEHWTPCREVAGGRLAGDCEDFCISLAEACDAAGLPAADLTLYLVAIEAGPDHVVLGCRDGDREWIADCNSRVVRDKARPFYFRWVSQRNLADDHWIASP